MNIENNKKMMLECIDTLIDSCNQVGGVYPNFNMTLREFITSYGWNGVIFGLSELYKKEE